MSDIPDWISAACSGIAALIGLVTLVTVFVAARQLLTEYRIYQLGLSEECLGPWHAIAEKKRLLGMQRQVFTPKISLPNLRKSDWQPDINFPVGFCHESGQPGSDPERGPATATWVNFVQALGLSPEDDQFYNMSAQSNLVNGIIPMRWSGKDLVAICTLLGFQSYEEKPLPSHPMPLPMQWSGPLGWLQFRESPDGCVVEFRRRSLIPDQLSSEIHAFYKNRTQGDRPHLLVSRLWRSINGMCLRSGKVLYLGGADKKDSKQASYEELEKGVEELEEKWSELQKGIDTLKTRIQNGDVSYQGNGDLKAEDHGLFDELMQGDFTDADIMAMVRGRKPLAPEPEAADADKDTERRPDFLRRLREKKKGPKEVLFPCPGLLSIIVEGELADSRGLDMADCTEYHRKYIEESRVDQARHKYRLGNLCIDDDLLPVMKDAMEMLRPDGYYFTPTKHNGMDVLDIYQHVGNAYDKSERARVFPPFQPANWPDSCAPQDREALRHAMLLCGEFQHIRKNNRAMFTIEDMITISKASESLQQSMRGASDLCWAMLICPKLFDDLADAFEELGSLDFLGRMAKCRDETLDIGELLGDRGDGEDASGTVYTVPRCADGEFQGTQVLAAFMDVCITFFWIEKSWVTDVGLYDATIPQTIIMC